MEHYIKFAFCVLTAFGVQSCYQISSNDIQNPVLSVKRLVPTPPMGWNSWNKFQCTVNDKIIREVADAMVTNGMKEAGYLYINIDDCWDLENRVEGHLKANPATFPDGIKSLSEYIHSKGLKFGIYSDRGKSTCQGKAGSYGYETIDAQDFADWGVDYLKYDNCNIPAFSSEAEDFRKMREALDATGRSIVFSICAWGFLSWMPDIGNLWRTGGDIHDDWESMMGEIDNNEKWASYAHPGSWNDPDMLEIGNGGMNDTEYRTHFSMWAIMAAPLIAGNDVRKLSNEVKQILLNQEVIAVDQDPLGLQGIPVSGNDQGSNVYSKVLQGPNTRAVALINRANSPATVFAQWNDLGIPSGGASVRDLWNHRELGIFKDHYKVLLPPHGTALIKVVSSMQ